MGSPPLKTMIGVPMSATASTSPNPSVVVSSRGSRHGRADARQWRQASAQACVVSQMTRNGARSKSTAGRAMAWPCPAAAGVT